MEIILINLKKIIENEDNNEYQTFEELNLYNNFEIYFITRDTRDETEDEKKNKFENIFIKKEPKMDDKIYLKFKTLTGQYPII